MNLEKYNDLEEKSYDTIQNVFNAAAEQGLEVEVFTLMMNIIKDNPDISIEEAASEALLEWDI
jgi:hypothetical protein